jgi:hypothetical protein
MEQNMICPRCSGTGSEVAGYHSSPDFGYHHPRESRPYHKPCELCKETGAVKFVRRDKLNDGYFNCGKCDGKGYTWDKVPIKWYSSGRIAEYADRKISCKHCNGKGGFQGRPQYIDIYEPDFSTHDTKPTHTKRASEGCLLLVALPLLSMCILIILNLMRAPSH